MSVTVVVGSRGMVWRGWEEEEQRPDQTWLRAHMSELILKLLASVHQVIVTDLPVSEWP